MMFILSQGGINHSIVKNHGKCKTKKSTFLPSNVQMDNHVCRGMVGGRRKYYNMLADSLVINY